MPLSHCHFAWALIPYRACHVKYAHGFVAWLLWCPVYGRPNADKNNVCQFRAKHIKTANVYLIFGLYCRSNLSSKGIVMIEKQTRCETENSLVDLLLEQSSSSAAIWSDLLTHHNCGTRYWRLYPSKIETYFHGCVECALLCCTRMIDNDRSTDVRFNVIGIFSHFPEISQLFSVLSRKFPCWQGRVHRNGNVFILMKLSSLAALEVVKMTTSSAVSDENFVKMTTFLFQCLEWIRNNISL